MCANAASDTLSVIDTRTDAVVETIWARPTPADLFGAQPNALAFDASGRTLYVANGTQNAVGVVAFEPADRASRLQGLIPVGWFPGALAFDAKRRTLHAANIKGHAAVPKPYEDAPAPGAEGFNSHQYHGSLSLVPVPDPSALPGMSETVWRLSQSPREPREGPRARLAEWANRQGVSFAQSAIAWLLARSPAMLPIPGTSSVAHLEDNVAAPARALTAAELATIG